MAGSTGRVFGIDLTGWKVESNDFVLTDWLEYPGLAVYVSYSLVSKTPVKAYEKYKSIFLLKPLNSI